MVKIMNIPTGCKNILITLHSIGFEAYIIGGACRDFLFDSQPKDFDIVTNATTDELLELLPYTKKTGDIFPVVRCGDYEIATYRKDIDETVIVTETLEEDVVRRDFTINGIAYDINIQNYIDYVCGLDDIKNRVLRFIGCPQTRIKEDPIRMLRGLRFASQYNLTIEKETFFAIFQHRKLLKEIPTERIQLEVIKAFSHKNTHRFLTLLTEMEMLGYVFPSLLLLQNIDGGRYHNETVLSHSFNAVKAIEKAKWNLKLAALYHDMGKHTYLLNDEGNIIFKGHNELGIDYIKNDLKYLNFSNTLINYVTNLSLLHMSEVSDSDRCVRKLYSKLLEANISLRDFILLRYADNKGDVLGYTDFREMWSLYKKCLKVINKPQPFAVKDLAVSGLDIMTEFYLEPSKEVGVLLKTAFEAFQNGDIQNNKEDIMNYLKENYCEKC